MNFHLSILLGCLLVILASSCTEEPTYFEAAYSAVIVHDLSALRVAVAADSTVVHQGNDYDGGTLLHHALVNSPSFECAEFLLAEGADPNKPDVTGEYPIHVICRFNGDIKCLKLLLDNGADPSIKWKDGSTPAQLARKWNFEEAALMLEAASITP